MKSPCLNAVMVLVGILFSWRVALAGESTLPLESGRNMVIQVRVVDLVKARTGNARLEIDAPVLSPLPITLSTNDVSRLTENSAETLWCTMIGNIGKEASFDVGSWEAMAGSGSFEGLRLAFTPTHIDDGTGTITCRVNVSSGPIANKTSLDQTITCRINEPVTLCTFRYEKTSKETTLFGTKGKSISKDYAMVATMSPITIEYLGGSDPGTKTWATPPKAGGMKYNAPFGPIHLSSGIDLLEDGGISAFNLDAGTWWLDAGLVMRSTHVLQASLGLGTANLKLSGLARLMKPDRQAALGITAKTNPGLLEVSGRYHPIIYDNGALGFAAAGPWNVNARLGTEAIGLMMGAGSDAGPYQRVMGLISTSNPNRLNAGLELGLTRNIHVAVTYSRDINGKYPMYKAQATLKW